MSLRTVIQQPFPYDSSLKGKVGMAVFFGLFIFVFLVVFQPFDLDFLSRQRLFVVALIYGAITFSCVFSLTVLMAALFPHWFNEKVWTTGRHILSTMLTIFVVGLVNFLLSPVLVQTTLTFERAIWFQGITLAMALPPVSIFILIRQNQLLKKFRGDAAAIEKRLQQKIDGDELMVLQQKKSPANKLVLTGDYGKEELEVYTDDLHVINSANNYIKVYHLQKDRLIYCILRSTLKKAEDITVNYPNLFKCHRAYIVNLDKVVHVEGNAQGYKLRIEKYEELIPVSRNLSAEFSDKLLAYRKSQAS